MRTTLPTPLTGGKQLFKRVVRASLATHAAAPGSKIAGYSRRTMPKRALAVTLSLSLGVTAAGCSGLLDLTDLVEASFLAEPDTVPPGDTFQAIFTVRNLSADTVSIGSVYGCFFFLTALRGDARVPIKGTDYGCAAVFRNFLIAPTDSLRIVHEIVALKQNTAPPYAYDIPLAAGTYRLRAQMNTGLPDMETVVTVIDSVSTTQGRESSATVTAVTSSRS